MTRDVGDYGAWFDGLNGHSIDFTVNEIRADGV